MARFRVFYLKARLLHKVRLPQPANYSVRLSVMACMNASTLNPNAPALLVWIDTLDRQMFSAATTVNVKDTLEIFSFLGGRPIR